MARSKNKASAAHGHTQAHKPAQATPIEMPAPNILLLSCMDLRLLDETVAFMDRIEMTNRYDHVILAGASLGAVFPDHPHWAETFWDHVKIAKELHDIREIYILEHRNCGAYRKLLGLDFHDDHDAETVKHAEVAHWLKTLIHLHHPELGVRCLLMDLEGEVEEI